MGQSLKLEDPSLKPLPLPRDLVSYNRSSRRQEAGNSIDLPSQRHPICPMIRTTSDRSERQPVPNSRIRTVVAIVFTSLALVACSDPGDPLPGGYFIFRASSSEVYLNEPKYNGSIPKLGTDLQEIGNHNEYIFGRSGSARGTTPGFFMLDTKTGALQVGLTETNWLSATAAAGIPQPPKLVDPTRKKPLKQ